MALGLHKRFGWRIVAFAAVISNVPDMDGLPMLFDMERFESGHRVWGHNFFLIVATSICLGWTQARFKWIQKIVAYAIDFLPSEVNRSQPSRHLPIPILVLIFVGIGFQTLHLVCDMVVSGGARIVELAGQAILANLAGRLCLSFNTVGRRRANGCYDGGNHRYCEIWKGSACRDIDIDIAGRLSVLPRLVYMKYEKC